MDYQPLDLTSSGNLRLRKPAGYATGAVHFHGLPFAIACEEDAALVIGWRQQELITARPVQVSVGQCARWLIFAHGQLDSHLHQGEHPGHLVAMYGIHFEHRNPLELPVRERFETGVIPVDWGELPFLAEPDEKDDVFSRHRKGDWGAYGDLAMPRRVEAPTRFTGEWGQAGLRQTEVRQAWPRDYYLWAWRNPYPQEIIEYLSIDPGNYCGFFLAAVTLSLLEEEPFTRQAAVPVRIDLKKLAATAGPFDLEVEVDRGTASYPYALPQEAREGFHPEGMPAWGEPYNEGNSPAYLHLAATPSATIRVNLHGEEVGSVNWGELSERGVVDSPSMRLEVVNSGRNWVHTEVRDAETGHLIPCRVHFRDGHGIPWQPHGHHTHVNSNLGSWHVDLGGDIRLGQTTYAYVDGTCQGWLPRGEVWVEVARGFEYEPLRTRVEILPGQRRLELKLARNCSLQGQRYFSGDPHVHFLNGQGALLEAAAEDVNVVSVLLTQLGGLFTNTEEFTGRPLVSRDGGNIVHMSQENRQHMLGHLSLLGLKEPVMPWCSGGPAESTLGDNLEITMSHWADACRAQGGTVIIPHLPTPNGEPAALIATGRADAVEMLVHDEYNHLEYYRYLNGGYRLPLVGGTDRMDNGVPVGLFRTYAYLPPEEEFTYDNWCRSVQRGNTFLSSGPLIDLLVEGKPPGETIYLGGRTGSLEVTARAWGVFPIQTLQLIHNGEVVAQTEESVPSRELTLKTKVHLRDDGWLCARTSGAGYHPQRHFDSWSRGIMAHTSPVYVATGREYAKFDEATVRYMLTLVDGCLQYMQQRARQWPAGTVTHHHSAADHHEFLESPLREALHALHHRLHQHGIPH